MKYGDVAEDLRLICAAFSRISPWLSAFLAKLRVVGVEDMPCDGAVSDRGVIFINVRSWRNASMEKKKFIVLHEVLHVALGHFARARKVLERDGLLDLRLFNLACDYVIDRLIIECLPKMQSNIMKYLKDACLCDKVLPALKACDVRKMSSEEIYHLLKKLGGDKGAIELDSVVVDLCFDGEYDEEDIIWKGDHQIYSTKLSQEEAEERIREALMNAVVHCRVPGRGMGAIDIAVERVLKPKVNWRAELKESVRRGVGRSAVSTWLKPHRKLPGLVPGVVKFSRPNVYCLVDVSGSIDWKTVNQFFAEVFAAARLCRVFAVFFDDGVRGVFEVRPGSVPKVKGGGGTQIGPALKLAYERARRSDVVAVLTDGAVYDVREQEEWLEKLASKVSGVIYCSTYRFPKANVRKIVLEV